MKRNKSITERDIHASLNAQGICVSAKEANVILKQILSDKYISLDTDEEVHETIDFIRKNNGYGRNLKESEKCALVYEELEVVVDGNEKG